MSSPSRARPWKRRATSTCLLLDKTGTITIGNRKATNFYPAPGVSDERFREILLLSSLSDNTPEGKSIVELAREQAARSPVTRKNGNCRTIRRGYRLLNSPPKPVAAAWICRTGMARSASEKAHRMRFARWWKKAEHVFPAEMMKRVNEISGDGTVPAGGRRKRRSVGCHRIAGHYQNRHPRTL